MLSDKIASIRLDALKSLLPIYTDANLAELGTFTDRFKVRILQIAGQDVDSSVRIAALQCLSKIAQLHLLDEEDAKNLVPIVFDFDSKIRLAVAPIFSALLSEKTSEMEADGVSAKFQCLCQILLENRHSSPLFEINEKKDPIDNLEYEEEDLFRQRQSDQDEWLAWYSNDMPINGFSNETMDHVVTALWQSVDIVKVS
jgi:hypothetical protein